MGGITLRDLERERVGAAAVAAVAEETAAAAAAASVAAAVAATAAVSLPMVQDGEVVGGRDPGAGDSAGIVEAAPEAFPSVHSVAVGLEEDSGGGGGGGGVGGALVAPTHDHPPASAAATMEAPSEVAARAKRFVM